MIPPARTDWGAIALLFAIGLLAAAQFGRVAVALPEVAAAHDRPVTAIAWLVSIVGVVGIALGAMAGAVVAALGPARVLMWSAGLGAGLAAVQGLPLPLAAVGLARVGEGVSHLGLVVAAPTLIVAAATDRDRPLAMGIWAMFFGVSFALAAWIVPALVAAGGLALLHLAHGGGLALMAAAARARFPRGPATAPRLAPRSVHAEIYGHPRRALPGLCFVFYTLLFVALVTLLPVLTGRPELAARLPLLTLAGTLAAGVLGRRVAPVLLLAAGFATVAALALPLAAGATWPLAPLFLALGLPPGAAFAAIPALNGDPAGQARATGGIAQMGNVGTTLGTPVFAAIAASAGQGALWLAVAAASLAGLATLGVMLRRVDRADRAERTR